MKVMENVQLSNFTTIKIGGTVKKMFYPENSTELDDLEDIINAGHILGGGSNLLITDESIDSVICLKQIDNKLTINENGEVYAGASVRLQNLIKFINSNGYGGVEYLYSVPGLVGGAIFMNAGSGKPGEELGDYVVRAKVWHHGKVEYLEQNQCQFRHRSSKFKTEGDYVILGAYFKFKEQDQKTSEKLIYERLKMCREMQDNSGPNFGSAFKVSNSNIMNVVKKLHLGNKKGCHYSTKSANWMINGGAGTFKEASKLIKQVQRVHKLLGKKCEVEVIMWE